MSKGSISIEGNLTKDPELRYTQSGSAVASFTVAENHFKKDQQGQWVQAGTSFYDCSVWNRLAENVAESLSKGMSVVVVGSPRQREYDAQDGTRRRVFEIAVDSVGPSLRFATAQVTRNPQQGQGQGQWQGQQAQQPQQQAQGQWQGQQQPQQQAAGGNEDFLDKAVDQGLCCPEWSCCVGL